MYEEQKVAQFIFQQRLLSEKAFVLSALSGGADSVAMTLMLKHLGYRVEAVHCNFHLRGEESQRDEQFCVDFCQRHEIPLHRAHFDTHTYCSVHHVSIEVAARQLRYDYFAQLASDVHADVLCTAHHQDDLVETFLLNLIRGTGLQGLTGIPAKGLWQATTPLQIRRPMLCLSRNDILSYLSEQQQAYVTDSTNLSPEVTMRNALRHRIIPALCSLRPTAPQAIASATQRLAQAQLVMHDAVTQAISQCALPLEPSRIPQQQRYSIQVLLRQPSPETVLFTILHPHGFSPRQVESISERLSLSRPAMFLSPSRLLCLHRGTLILSPRLEPAPPCVIPETGCYHLHPYCGAEAPELTVRVRSEKGAHISRNTLGITLDANRVHFPLHLRVVREGDRFQPFGMRQTKTVLHYLNHCQRSRLQKQQQLLLTDADDNVLWVVSERIAQNYAVSNDTEQTLFVNIRDSMCEND